MRAIQTVETGKKKNCKHIGNSGEHGCFQYLNSTWKIWSKEVIGYVPKMSYINEKYVAMVKVEKWTKQGYSPFQIALIWNGGVPREKKGTKRGINGKKYRYNSGNYAKLVLKNME